MYDTIIIGAGPAGLTAAIYLIRKKVNLVLLTQQVGGQILDGPLIENYPGFGKITGPEWVAKVRAQTEKLGVEIKEGAEVKKINKIDNGPPAGPLRREASEAGFEVEGNGWEKIQGKTILIASGKRARKLNVPGEEELLGKGISTCVTCDGPLFKEKTVAVIGGGNSAISAALELEKYVEKVYILNLGETLVGEEVRIDQLKKSNKVEIVASAKTTEIIGDKLVEHLKYKDLKSNEEKEIAVSGIFVEIGWEPSTNYLEGFVELSPQKEIKIDTSNRTNIEGVFAAGDATTVKYKQAVIACGEGAKAALATWDYLSKLT